MTAEERAPETGTSKVRCPTCGNATTPLVKEPAFGSAEWWDDPSGYLACADCGAFLAWAFPSSSEGS